MSFTTINFFRQVVWFMNADRISWMVFFPLMTYFFQQQRWIACGACTVGSVLVLTLRGTIDNFRTIARAHLLASQQSALDNEAKDTLRALRCEPPTKRRPIIMFLRPFSGDKKIHAKDPNSSHEENYHAEPLETLLAASFVSRYTTVSLRSPVDGRSVWGDAFADMRLDVTIDHPDFHLYAGRLFYRRFGEVTVPDSEWLETFRLLAKHANLIFSIPVDMSSSTELGASIIELLDLRNENMFGKCVFVMPPEQSFHVMRPLDETIRQDGGLRSWRGSHEIMLSSMWNSTQEKLGQLGFVLPDFRDTSDGATVFTLSPGTSEVDIINVGLRDLRRPKRYLKKLNIHFPHK